MDFVEHTEVEDGDLDPVFRELVFLSEAFGASAFDTKLINLAVGGGGGLAFVMYAMWLVKSTLSRVEDDFNVILLAPGDLTSILVISLFLPKTAENDFARAFQVDITRYKWVDNIAIKSE